MAQAWAAEASTDGIAVRLLLDQCVHVRAVEAGDDRHRGNAGGRFRGAAGTRSGTSSEAEMRLMGERPSGASRPGTERLATGVPGLDDVLNGGFLRGGLYLVGGAPGTGKTTLGNQLAYRQAAAGDVTVYGTVLAEPHGQMLANLSGFTFFDPEEVARNVHYVSVYDELSANGLSGALALLRRLVRERNATILFLDGAGMFGDFARSPLELRRFINELHAQTFVLGCTTLLLANYDPDESIGLGTLTDGIVLLEDRSIGLRDTRLLRVLKLRGTTYLRGRHYFAIKEGGIEVYPRLETMSIHPPAVGAIDEDGRREFGVRGLDEMLGGGLPAGSATLLEGAPGAGKTIAGLHFVVEGCRRGQRGLIASFQEPPPRLIAKAEDLGLELGRHVESGQGRIVRHLPLELPLDAWARELLATVDEHQPTRLFVDALSDVQRLVLFPERFPAFLAALTDALHRRGVTTLFAVETPAVVGPEVQVPIPAVSATIDNTILLRYVELRSQLRRLISIVKVRSSDFDTSIREFVITARGIEVAETFESAEAVLTGVARLVPPPSRTSHSQVGRGSPGGVGRS